MQKIRLQLSTGSVTLSPAASGKPFAMVTVESPTKIVAVAVGSAFTVQAFDAAAVSPVAVTPHDTWPFRTAVRPIWSTAKVPVPALALTEKAVLSDAMATRCTPVPTTPFPVAVATPAIWATLTD